MNYRALLCLTAVGLLMAVVGCEHIDVSPAGSPERQLRGTVNAPTALAAGAVVVVQVVDAMPTDTGLAPQNDLPLGDRGRPPIGPRLLGEQRQVLQAPAVEPVPFELEYQADDAVL